MYQIEIFIACIVAYLLGSISSALIISKLMRLPDPRTHGSHNPGASNMLAIGGKKAALLTLLGDSLKGAIPIFFAKNYGLDSAGLSFTTFAAILGHLYPIFFRFQGGKGVATYLGCLLVLSWPSGLCFILTWVGVALSIRLASLSSLISTALTPLFLAYFTHDKIYVISFALITVLIFYRHRSNIKKIFLSSERKINL